MSVQQRSEECFDEASSRTKEILVTVEASDVASEGGASDQGQGGQLVGGVRKGHVDRTIMVCAAAEQLAIIMNPAINVLLSDYNSSCFIYLFHFPVL